MLAVKVLIAVGTYDGGVASYEMDLDVSEHTTSASINAKLQMIFASPVHQGSVRSLMAAATNSNTSNNNSNNKITDNQSKRSKSSRNEHDSTVKPTSSTTASSPPFILVSSGYDEMIKIHDYRKHTTCNGEIRLPTQYGTPNCSSFAPPYNNSPNGSNSSTHCLIGFVGGIENTTDVTAGKTLSASVGGSGGSLVIYKKRDWSVQHVLRGHEGGGIGSVAVHPSGKLALSGGMNDGKIKVWDLQRGRLAYTNSIQPKKVLQFKSSSSSSKKEYDAIVCIVWANNGECYGYCYGNHITVQHVSTGRDLLDVELPSKVNQICFINGTEGTFVAAACNDGSLPVLAIESIASASSSKPDDQERRAIMAIEPVDGPIAREERFKCIQSIYGYYVATANSAGVVSVMNLGGAVNMITSPSNTTIEDDGDDDRDEDDEEDIDDNEDDDDDESEQELAVDIIDSVQIGNGARITCLVAWTTPLPDVTSNTGDEPLHFENIDGEMNDSIEDHYSNEKNHNKKKRALVQDNRNTNIVELDPDTLSKARALVSQAKKIQRKKNDKRMKGLNASTNR